MELVKLSIQDLKEMKFVDIKVVVNEWDTQVWREAAAMKSTLRLYCKYKDESRQESWFNNSDDSKLMFRGRTDTLDSLIRINI